MADKDETQTLNEPEDAVEQAPSSNETDTPSVESDMPPKNQEPTPPAPPPGVYVETVADLGAADMAGARPKPQPAFTDEFVGQGGRYRVNPETGVREPVYEAYTDDNGQTQYRKVY